MFDFENSCEQEEFGGLIHAEMSEVGDGCGYGDWDGMRFPAAAVDCYNKTFVVCGRDAVKGLVVKGGEPDCGRIASSIRRLILTKREAPALLDSTVCHTTWVTDCQRPP